MFTRNSFQSPMNNIQCVVSTRGSSHSRQHSTSLLRPWYFVDNLNNFELAIACNSTLEDVGKLSRKISFPALNNDDEQIKQLEFMLGELKIDMEIMFERICSTSNFDSVGSMTSIENTESTTQTDDIIGNNDCEFNSNGDAANRSNEFIYETEVLKQQIDEIQRIFEQYENELLHLTQENNKWQRKNSNHGQMIASLSDEIEQKNQLVTTAKEFIEKHIKNIAAIVRKNIEANNDSVENGVGHVECQQCHFTSNLLSKTQLEKDKLNMEKIQLEQIILVQYNAEIQALNSNLRQHIAIKNDQDEKILDIIRSLQSQLSAENDMLKKDVDNIKSKLVALEDDNHNLAVKLEKKYNESARIKGCSKLFNSQTDIVGTSTMLSKKKEFIKPTKSQVFDNRTESKLLTKTLSKQKDKKTKDQRIDPREMSTKLSPSNLNKHSWNRVQKGVNETKTLKLDKSKVEKIRSTLVHDARLGVEKGRQCVSKSITMSKNQRSSKQTKQNIRSFSPFNKATASTKSQNDDKMTSLKRIHKATPPNPKPKSIPLNQQQLLNQRQKLDRKTSPWNILIRVVHEDEKNHRKTFGKVGVEYSGNVTNGSRARAERLNHLTRLIIEQNSIELIAIEDLQFLRDNFNPGLSKTLSTIVSKNDLDERLKRVKYLETEMPKSKETNHNWCNVS